MTNEQVIDGYSWALTVEVMRLVGHRLPVADRRNAFAEVYVRAMAALQCFDERRCMARDSALAGADHGLCGGIPSEQMALNSACRSDTLSEEEGGSRIRRAP